ncbi:MAG: PaaI family thioesterase [Dehalococcoidia bacterium]|nr:PaaI family thioesterase [Dehalococcoidia bacterium]|tara:strand:+ start:87 stop:542 length:456 start_codon:yes stop_codon:yes gene_type:complete
MPNFEPRDPDFKARVRNSFGRQTAMRTLGAVVNLVEPGEVEIEMPYRADLTQQHGFIHGGIVTAIVDSACGYAAFSLSAPDTAVLTVEYKVNFVASAKGERLVARGEVVRPGATVTVCKGNVLAYEDGEEKLVATMLTTLMLMPNRPDLAG